MSEKYCPKSDIILCECMILKNSMSYKTTIENHHIVTTTHELWIDGHHLIEKKQKTHIRSIDEKSYKVTEIKNGDDAATETQVETDMAEDEVKKFEEDWTSLWNPDIKLSVWRFWRVLQK